MALTNLDGTGVYHHYGGVVSELTTDGTSWSFSDHYTIQNQNHGRVSWPNIIPIPDTMANCKLPEYETIFMFGRNDKDDPRPAIYLDFESDVNCTKPNDLTGIFQYLINL